LQGGVLYLYRDPEGLDTAWERAAVMREHGFALERLDAAGVARHEPAIDASRLAGALHAPGDQAGDAALVCRTLAERMRALGVEFQMENEIVAIEGAGTRVRDVRTRRGPVTADAFVCALGVMGRKLREQLGTHVPVYPVKGYSATVPVVRAGGAPRSAAIDESRRVAFAPLGGELRITGGAEFAGYGMQHAPADFAPLYDAAKQLFPGALDYARAKVRACLRPMTPETTPRFGTGRYQNLWFNIGLGHMGFALAAGAGRITADLVCGNAPAIDLEGLRIRRH
jgi:D-amino-acid dehydrogenase